MEQVILIDTNVISRYFNDNLEEDLILLLEASNFKISVITRIELLAWEKYNQAQIDIINDFISNCEVIALDEKIILKTIEIRKKYKIKLPDAIIASSAIVFGATLISLDSDFRNIKGLQVIGN